ncbi:MAG: hypothetical protein GKR88_17095 [Flavobacteriaceae bacterium]|nr:MAG: hypothetical protein GKR88_17095 [Flavobacteriaceae bacterium]
MRTVFLFLVIFFVSCSPRLTENQRDQDIIYILPKNIEENLNNLLLLKFKQSNNVYFDFRKKEKNYIVHVSNLDVYWKGKTNRKVLIKDVLYPLFFEIDFSFATMESLPEILKRLNDEKSDPFLLRKSQSVIYDRAYKIEFDDNGKIIKQNW